MWLLYVILILISIALTLIGGYIPAKIASKKEAVDFSPFSDNKEVN